MNLVATIKHDVSHMGVSVKSSLSDINGTVSNIQGDVLQVDGDLDLTKQELTLYKNYIGTIQQSIADIIKDVRSLQRTGTYTAQSNEELKKMIADLNSTTEQVNLMKATVDKISSDVHGLHINAADISSWDARMQTNATDIASTKNKLKTSAAEISSLDTRLKTNAADIASTNTTLSTVQAKLSEISNAISAVPSSSRIDVLQASYDDLKKALATMDYASRIDALQASYDQIKNTLASLDSSTVKAVGSDSLAVKSSVCVGDQGVCVLHNTINTGGGVQSGRLHIAPKENLYLLPKGGTYLNTHDGADPKIHMQSELKGKHAALCIDGSCMIGDFGGKSGRLHIKSHGDVFMLPAKGTYFTADWGATPTIKMVSGGGKTAQLCIDDQCLTKADLLKLRNLI
jgi:predicted  nucleic acid-binding Zn-ribbon protein